MPARRRRSKRARGVAGLDGFLFVLGDGVRPFFGGDEVYENVFLARAAWQEARAMSWAHEDRHALMPPRGAEVYDKISASWHAVRSYDPGEFRSAVEADVASVEAFRRSEPAKAASVSRYLDEYVADLRFMADLVDAASDSEINPRDALIDYWMRRNREHRAS